MNWILSGHTDIGTTRNTNQDSFTFKEKFFSGKQCSLLVMCDGMGGLSNGEVASRYVVERFEEWFEKRFPFLFLEGITDAAIRQEWTSLIKSSSTEIMNAGIANSAKMGTTVVALLITPGRYYIVNVGDSRAIKISDKVERVTKDHSLVERELALGNITAEEALTDKRRNVLLQCVGACENVNPDFFFGEPGVNECFVLCSDGFWHNILPEELYEQFNPADLRSEKVLRETIAEMVELVKQRGETDNITAVAAVRSEEEQTVSLFM